MRASSRIALLALVSAVAVGTALGPITAASAGAKKHGKQASEAWVVSIGDSYISGEAGRWAGNETYGTRHIDALGPRAYWDTPTGEAIPNCHRSKSAVIHIGVANSMNFACSGATTQSAVSSDGDWKPGIDFYDKGDRKGQALMLQEFARDHDVRMVALSIGGNDFHFGDIVTECVKDFVIWSGFCKDSSVASNYIDGPARLRVRDDIAAAIGNVAVAMSNAGKKDSEWELVLQLYPQPIPESGEFRYGEGAFGFRQAIGGCGFYNADADWAVTSLLPTVNKTVKEAARLAEEARPTLTISLLDTTGAFKNRELCQKAVNRVDSPGGVPSWQHPDAVDRSEWVQDINIVKLDGHDKQESLHPNYWGQLALRDCWRSVWDDGDIRGGSCKPVGGLNKWGEPQMRLTGSVAKYEVG